MPQPDALAPRAVRQPDQATKEQELSRSMVRSADRTSPERPRSAHSGRPSRSLVRQRDHSHSVERPAFTTTNEVPGRRHPERSGSETTLEGPKSADLTAVSRRFERPAFSAPRGARSRALIVGCGALARELVALTADLPGIDVACLPPELHNRPGGIPSRVRARIRQGRRDGYERIFVAYADCGTGGLLDPVLQEEGVERLPGAHCYEFFAGRTNFAELAEDEPATFWLTDFLARNFERLVIRGLGIDRHPELEAMYFGNYKRVVYLSQTDDPDLVAKAEAAANRLGLVFEHRRVGLGELASSIREFARPTSTGDHRATSAVTGRIGNRRARDVAGARAASGTTGRMA